MKRILLVQQYLGHNNEVGPIFPIGLSYLATAIERTNWEIKAIDMNVYDDPYQKLSEILSIFRPDVVALSLRNIDNVDYDEFNYFYLELKTMIKAIKTHDCCLIVGGAGFSIFAKEICERNNEIDYGLVQEGEVTIVELLNSIQDGLPVNTIRGLYYRENDKVCYSGDRPPMNFSKSPIPNREYFEMEKYSNPLSMGVQTKRGCSLKCSYCTYPFLNKHSERFRDAESVVDEIEELIDKYGVREIIFCDDIFNVPLEHSVRIINLIIDRGIKIKWSAWFDIANTTEDFMRLAIRSGCYRFCFSTEGVIDRTLKLLHKNFTAKQADHLINICQRKEFDNIDFRFSLFAMPPGQTFYGMLKTIIVVFKTHVMKRNCKCLVSWIRVLPNTELYNSMNMQNINLLPEVMSEGVKESLFYNSNTYPRIVVEIYKLVLKSMNRLRRLRKMFI